MSKELTEQWHNGTLPENWYYIHLKSNWGNIDCITINYCDEDGVFEEYPDEDIKEALAKVPTYDQFVELTEKVDQFSQLVKKVERLEKKLDIAVKILEAYARGDSDAGNGCLYETPAPSLAQKALKEIDLVGTSMSLAKDV